MDKKALDHMIIVKDLNGVDSNLSIKGDIINAITKMIDSVPVTKYNRCNNMTLYMSNNIASEITSPARIYNDIPESVYMQKTFGKKDKDNRKIGEFVISDDILVDDVDIKGEHDRMLLYCINIIVFTEQIIFK